MYFHEGLALALRDQGVQDIFGVIGDGNLFIMDSFQRAAGGHFYSMSHESAAVVAANGYAHTRGGLGVATVTHGPGLTNTLTALVDGVKSHAPILLLAGDTAVVDRNGVQVISQRELIVPTGAGFEQVRSPETVFEDVAIAVRRAILESRPVVLNVPVDFQWAEIDRVPSPIRYVEQQAIAPAPELLERVVGVISVANRPLILAGQGAAAPKAREALIELAQRIGAPLATTLLGRDLFEGEPHNLGIFGTLSHEVALETILEADVIIAFGASLNDFTSADGSTLAGKTVIHVDTDRFAIGQHVKPHVGVIGDVEPTAAAIIAMLDEAEIGPSSFASPKLAARLASRDEGAYQDLSTDITVDIRTAMRRVEAAFPKERTVVTDGGRFLSTAFHYLHVPEPHAFVFSMSFGSIGLGMGSAIGAYFGSPKRPVLLVTGDGGLMLGGLSEFSSAVRHGVDLVVVIINDGAYGAEHVQFRDRGLDPSISTFEWPDFGPVATALGGLGYTVRNLAELDAALKASQERDRPILIDIRVDPDLVPGGHH